MTELFNLIATLGVALIGVWGIKIQTKSKEKQENIMTEIENLHNGNLALEKKIDDDLKQAELLNLKIWLVTELTKIKRGVYTPNEEQKALIHEAKKVYNDYNGNSYVDNMFESLVQSGLL